MSEHLALKRLTASDLTLFESLFRRLDAGNQKAINLNADVFIGAFYPTVPTIAPRINNEIPLVLTIYGPGGKLGHRLTRKVIKNPTYKNWRLDGEFIRGPEEDPGRYDPLQPGDLAVMLFRGDPVPSGLDMVVVAQDVAQDANLHAALSPLLGDRSMMPITVENVATAIAASAVPVEHPVNALIVDPEFDAALEDVAFGGELGIRKLQTRRPGRKVSSADLARARQSADRTGLAGEGLINALLTMQMAGGILAAVEWSSESNAISPYDFLIRSAAGSAIKLDVKSTTGPFENEFHISIAELIEAAKAPERYDLYRVYELNEEGGKLRISEGIRGFASTVLARLDLPAGVKCDGFSVSFRSEGLIWSEEIYVARPAGDETEDTN